MLSNRMLIPIVFLLLALGSIANAQYSLSVKEVDASAFPKVKLRLVARNGEVIVRQLDSTNYTVTEDGMSQSPLSLKIPSGSGFISFGALIANGSSVKAADFEKARLVMSDIAAQISRSGDDINIMTYGSTANQAFGGFTSVRSTINNFISAMACGAEVNHLWDAVWDAITYMTSSKIMLIITNGVDDGSSHGLSAVIAKNQSIGVKFFILGIGLTGSPSDLITLANSSGGAYFANTDLVQQIVVDYMRGTPEYNEVTYTSNNACRDGVARAIHAGVSIQASQAACDSLMALSASSATQVPTQIRIDTGSVVSGKTITLGMRLLTQVNQLRFYPGQMVLTFDTSKVQLTSINNASTLCKDNTFTITRTAVGAMVDFSGTTILNGTGNLFNMVFTAREVAGQHIEPIVCSALNFSRGCIQPTVTEGKITVKPRSISITAKSSTYVFEWNDLNKEYNPKVQEISVEVTNSGDFDVTKLIAVFPSDPTVRLAWGTSDTAIVVPDSLKPGQKGIARFLVKPVPTAVETITPLDIRVTCAEGTDAPGRAQFVIRASSSALRITGSVDPIQVVGGVYVPDPVPVHAVVHSAGTSMSPAGSVNIILPPGLTLASGDPNQPFVEMAGGTNQTFNWTVDYPSSSVGRQWPILLALRGADPWDDTIEVVLDVPALTAANVQTSKPTGAPVVIAWDSTSNAYMPLEFTLASRFANIGTAVSDTLTAAVTTDLPLATGETTAKVVSHGLNPNDSATVQWRMTPPQAPLCHDSVFTIVFQAGSCCPARVLRTDTITVLVTARPDLAPEIVSRMPFGPDTLISKDSTATFVVNAIDANGDPLTYVWTLNGSVVGTNSPSYTQKYSDMSNYTLVCTVSDGCKSVDVQWNFQLTGVDAVNAIANQFGILANHPNPFAHSTTVDFLIPDGTSGAVTMEVLDMSGRVVATVLNEFRAGGTHSVTFDLSGRPSGAYVIRLRSGRQVSTLPVLLTR